MAGRGGLLDQIQKGARLTHVDAPGDEGSSATPPPKGPSPPGRGGAVRPAMVPTHVYAPPRDVMIERRPPPPTAPPANHRPTPAVPPTPAMPTAPPRTRAKSSNSATPEPPAKVSLLATPPPSMPPTLPRALSPVRSSAKSLDLPDAPIPQPMHMRMGSNKHHKTNSIVALVADIEPIPSPTLATKSPKHATLATATSFISSVSLQLYNEHLRYNYPAAEAQATAGLYVNRRFASYLSKLCKGCLDYYGVVDQATRKEAGLGAEFRKDGMTAHVDAFVDLQSVFSTTSVKLQQFAQGVMADVVLPIQAHHAQATTQLRSITDQHRHLFKPFLPLHSQRQRCIEKLSEFMATKGPKASVLKSKLDAEFAKFEAMKGSLATATTHYHASTEPLLLSLQQLEEGRLRVLQNGLQELAKRCVVMDTSVPFVGEFAKSAQRLSEAKSMQEFASKPRVSASTKDHSNNVAGGPPVPDLPPLPVLDAMSPPSPRPTSTSFIQAPPSPAAEAPIPTPKLAPKLPSLPMPLASEESNQIILEAQWDYPGTGDSSYDLVFNQGDHIRLLDNFDIDWTTVQDGEPIWVTGTLLSNGATGGFPTNFVNKLT